MNMKDNEEREHQRLDNALNLYQEKQNELSQLFIKAQMGNTTGREDYRMTCIKIELDQLKDHINSLGRRLGRINEMRHFLP